MSTVALTMISKIVWTPKDKKLPGTFFKYVTKRIHFNHHSDGSGVDYVIQSIQWLKLHQLPSWNGTDRIGCHFKVRFAEILEFSTCYFVDWITNPTYSAFVSIVEVREFRSNKGALSIVYCLEYFQNKYKSWKSGRTLCAI